MPRIARRFARTGYVEVPVCLAVASAALVASPLNSDAGYVLVAARRMLEGDRLYVDVIETNPPLVFFAAATAESS